MTLPIIENYINGEWMPSESGTRGDVWCPATGEKIAEVPYSTAAEVGRAVEAARAAFTEWRHTPPLTRSRYLFRFKELLEEYFEDIARVLVREEGKTIDESRGEVRRMIENLEHATGVTTIMTGYSMEDIADGIDCNAERMPMGVFGCVAPFNFPAMVPYWFMPYALVTGNTYIVKPSEQVPMTQTRIFEIIDDELNLPEGVLNMVHGSRDVVNAMLDHPDIEGISFVGSTPTARYIYERCGATGKRVQALGGAKNCVVVMPDADLDQGMPSLITSFYGCAGERCLSGAILVAVGDVYDELRERFVAAAKSLRVGDGLEETTQMGPVISAAHKERVLGYIEKFFVGPTVFDEVTPDMTIAQEEIFGPVVPITRVKDLEEAIGLVNSRGFANAACLYTTSGKTAREFKHHVEPSMLGINIGIAAPMAFFPFGGAGDSFFGDLKGHGREIFQFFTDTKVVISRWF
jgi:malonate-semialdehyde dehydrogenase (acetylating)/methylmalonate-semialdehyde dehydrogenase